MDYFERSNVDKLNISHGLFWGYSPVSHLIFEISLQLLSKVGKKSIYLIYITYENQKLVTNNYIQLTDHLR